MAAPSPLNHALSSGGARLRSGMLVDSTEPLDPALPENLVEVGSYETAIDGSDHGLVILALGRPYWLVPSDRRHRLLVEPEIAAAAQRQLASFDRESVGWPPLPPEHAAPRHPVDLWSPMLWALTVLGVFWGETQHPRWIAAGALDADGVFRRHEWWRLITALFLHANSGHVISNGLSGLFVFSAVVSAVGRVRGWLSLLVASVLGNAAAVALNFHGPYQSVGASTAVFAAVGILTGRAVRRLLAVPRGYRWRAMFTPLAAGVTVVALYGAGGVHVDVIAHFTGFLSGVLVGFVGCAEHRACS